MESDIEIGKFLWSRQCISHRPNTLAHYGKIFRSSPRGCQRGALHFQPFAHFHEFDKGLWTNENRTLKEVIERTPIQRLDNGSAPVDDIHNAASRQRLERFSYDRPTDPKLCGQSRL